MATLRFFVVLVALLFPVVSMTLAHIDPPDPTWAGGVWDDDDFDDAINAILHYAAVPPASLPGAGGPCWTTGASIGFREGTHVARSVPITDPPRGPPAHSLELA